MALDNSVVMVCTDANKASVNNALSAYFGDAPNSPEVGVPLCPSNVSPMGATPTAWGGAIWQDGVHATELKDWPNGTLPSGPDWSGYGLDDASALSAIQGKLSVSVQTGPGADPLSNFNLLLSSLNLQQVQQER